jgi:hypothetical protein
VRKKIKKCENPSLSRAHVKRKNPRSKTGTSKKKERLVEIPLGYLLVLLPLRLVFVKQYRSFVLSEAVKINLNP